MIISYQQVKDNILKNINKTLVELDFLLIKPHYIEKNKNIKYGHFCSNIAFLLASKYYKKSNEIAKSIVENLSEIEGIEKIEYQESGFINFFLKQEVWANTFKDILNKKDNYGKGFNIQEQYAVEILSANPNGFLHIGHVRSAIYTDAICNLLEYAGKKVLRLYLINDDGSQIYEIIKSVFAKYKFLLFGICYKELLNIKYNTEDAENCAKAIVKEYGSTWTYNKSLEDKLFYEKIKKFVVDFFIKGIEQQLLLLSIPIHIWNSQTLLTSEDNSQALIEKIKDYLYIKDGAMWFKTSHFDQLSSDDVVIKNDDAVSYFGQDLIYHLQKLKYINKTGKIINIFAIDHEGHIQRLKAFFKALNKEEQLIFKTIKLATTIEDGRKVVFSKRKNSLITFNELRELLTYEEIRWFFAAKDQLSDLTIDLSKLKNKDYHNPVFYIMYTYARIHQILIKVTDPSLYLRDNLTFDKLTSFEELNVIATLMHFEDALESAVKQLSPHILCQYVFSLSKEFNIFYEKCVVLGAENNDLKNERLALCWATQQIIKNCLYILKIKPKEKI